jgi:serine/threonine protein kinase
MMADVAIKAIKRPSSSPDVLDALGREMNMMRMMDHPFIVSFFDILHDDTCTYFVMELAQSGSLSRYLADQGRLAEEDARHFFYEIISVLDYLHNTKKVVHRDLKPQNILLDHNFHIRIVDFGLAKSWTAASPMMTETCGTAAYVAPEVLRGDPYSSSVDIWGAGVILYIMVAGRHPFADWKTTNVLQSIMTTDPPIPDCWSAALTHLVSNLLVKDPMKRITLADIKGHPWFEGYTDWVSFPHDFAQLCVTDVDDLDPRVLASDMFAEIDPVELLHELREHKINARTSAYKMLRKKRIIDDLGAIKPLKLALLSTAHQRACSSLNVMPSRDPSPGLTKIGPRYSPRPLPIIPKVIRRVPIQLPQS